MSDLSAMSIALVTFRCALWELPRRPAVFHVQTETVGMYGNTESSWTIAGVVWGVEESGGGG